MLPMLSAGRTCLALAALCLTLTPVLAAQQTVVPLWPTGTPEPPQTHEAEVDVTRSTDSLISGHRTARITNVTRPTMTVFSPPASRNNGAAALVFPGGGYIQLAWDGEGLDACKWLNSLGMTCLLVKYRVPEQGRFPENPADLEDAQQAMRLARAHSGEWHIDPQEIGVMGFSAGGNLAVLLSTHPDNTHVKGTPAAGEVPVNLGEGTVPEARPNFAIVVYPAYLIETDDPTRLHPVYTPNRFTPPTFLLQAENDRGYGRNAPVYYQALAAANVPAELHMYATGGHGFGMHPVGQPEEHWTQLAAAWLRSIHMLPPLSASGTSSSELSNGVPGAMPVPCPEPQPAAQPNRGANGSATLANTDPACW